MHLELYMPKHLLEAYITKISVENLPKFLRIHLDEDDRCHVKLPITLWSVYKALRSKLWNKKLCKDIILTNEGVGNKGEEETYRLDEGDYSLKKFLVIERVLNTHIIYKGVYSLYGELNLKYDFVSIPPSDISSRKQDSQLARVFKQVERLTLYTLDESKRFKVWCPYSVKGFAATTGLPFSVVFEFCFTHFILTDPIANELISLRESYLQELEADYYAFKKKIMDILDSIQTLKEMILEGVSDLASLLIRLMEEKGGAIAITPDVIRVLNTYGYSVESAIETLDKLAIEGVVKKYPDRWELCR